MSGKDTRAEAIRSVVDKIAARHTGPEHEPRPCPRDVADVTLQILQTGVAHARAAGWSSDAELAAIEANHVHNLPDLLRQYTHHKIRYYWNSERPSYVAKYVRHVGEEPARFAEHWRALEPLVPMEQPPL